MNINKITSKLMQLTGAALLAAAFAKSPTERWVLALWGIVMLIVATIVLAIEGE